MNIVITTLSLGLNYTKDYTLRLIKDVLDLTDIDIYVTTDCPQIINETFPDNIRIKIKYINRNDFKISLPIGINKGASDFNFNLRYLCLDHVSDLKNSIIIFTDCDNSFDWWDKQGVLNFIENQELIGYDFFGPRTDYKLINVFETFNSFCKFNPNLGDLDSQKCTIMWHKLYNYDMVDNKTLSVLNPLNHPWGGSPLPAEYLLIINNKSGKLKKMVESWKWFHDYLNNKDFTYGTWAEGFEIGVSANIAGFVSKDIGFFHELWSKIFTANGYKTGPRGGIYHATEK